MRFQFYDKIEKDGGNFYGKTKKWNWRKIGWFDKPFPTDEAFEAELAQVLKKWRQLVWRHLLDSADSLDNDRNPALTDVGLKSFGSYAHMKTTRDTVWLYQEYQAGHSL